MVARPHPSARSKSARRPLTLGWTASREKIITQSYNFMTAAAAGCK